VGDSGTQPRVIRNTDSETLEFVQCFNSDVDAVSATRRYDNNRAVFKDLPVTEVSPKPIIPTPLKVELAENTDEPRQVHIDSSWKVVYVGKQLLNEANFIASEIL